MTQTPYLILTFTVAKKPPCLKGYSSGKNLNKGLAISFKHLSDPIISCQAIYPREMKTCP